MPACTIQAVPLHPTLCMITTASSPMLALKVDLENFLADDECLSRRWEPAMESRLLQKAHWRKSNQWFLLTRKHAQVCCCLWFLLLNTSCLQALVGSLDPLITRRLLPTCYTLAPGR